jgi:hypothetical protein
MSSRAAYCTLCRSRYAHAVHYITLILRITQALLHLHCARHDAVMTAQTAAYKLKVSPNFYVKLLHHMQ